MTNLVLSTLQHYAGTAYKKKPDQSYHSVYDTGDAYGAKVREIALRKREAWLSGACEMSHDNTKGVEIQ